MLRVKTKIGTSGIHGTGLFADELIKKGTVTWQYDPNLDVGMTEEQINTLPTISKEFFLFYSYFDYERNIYILPVDHLRFINHINDPEKRNIVSTPDQDTAGRDIQPGEELLCDYNQFDPHYFKRLGYKDEDLS